MTAKDMQGILIAFVFMMVLLWAFSSTPHAPYAHALQLDRGRIQVSCANGADATIEPNPAFGTITVSCGTEE